MLNHKRLNRDDFAGWHRLLGTRGWSAPAWPAEYGGPGWNATQRHIWEEECARIGAPPVLPFGVSMVAPVLMKYGSEAQKRRYLPRILDGTDWWCQGYSEPGSGSISRRCARAPSAAAIITSSTARRPGRRSASTRT